MLVNVFARVARAIVIRCARVTTIHVIACVAAIIAGGMVIMRPKGTAVHRALGFVYVGATFAYCGSAFFMYPSTGRLTPFHLISIQNLVLVSFGISLPRFFRRRLRTWYAWHLRLMLYSYVALVITGLRFVFPYLPRNRVVPILVFVALPLGVWIWIERRLMPHWRARLAPRASISEQHLA